MTGAARHELERLLPSLQTANYEITSPPTSTYNCIGWALEDDDYWWWPATLNGALLGGAYWPHDVPPTVTLNAFELVFNRQNYRACADGTFEAGFDKIALYIDADGKPTHAARQLQDGRWTSKCGRMEDIVHDDALDVSGDQSYGAIAMFMRRESMPRPD